MNANDSNEILITFEHYRLLKPRTRRDRRPRSKDLVRYSRKEPHIIDKEQGIMFLCNPAIPNGGMTIATLKDKGTGQLLAQGQAWCSLADTFCYATGREIALKRAVERYRAWLETKRLSSL